jgi:hypothetical protein
MLGIGNFNWKKNRMRSLLFIGLLMCIFTASAQKTDRSSRYMKPQDRLVIDVTNLMLLEPAPGLSLRGWSPGFGAAVMHPVRLGKSFFWLAAGYGVRSMNYHMNGNFAEFETPSGTRSQFIAFDSGYSYDKHKWAITYAEIPFEFRYRNDRPNGFKFGIGGSIGYLINSHSKTIDDDGKKKFYALKGIETLNYALTARVGFGRYSAFVHYQLSRFTRNGDFPQMTPVSYGIGIQLI